ncbi:MAG: hypothetical protein H0W76_19505 [Pyrinomonadaceae bacterium]|nr:hypothetical protein [Pyrinomonadaceae bacterium]
MSIREVIRSVKEQVGFRIEIDFVPALISEIGIDSYHIIQAGTSPEDPNADFFLWYLGNYPQDFATPEEAAEAFVAAWFKFRPPLSLSGVH